MHQEISCDILIIGGGIAGLWLLEDLKQKGYTALLLECEALGARQSSKAQGIIHGGLKYALTGALTAASNALADLPNYWSECLAGRGNVDLSAVEVLAQHQYMWSTNKLTGGVATLFASSALRSHVATVPEKEWPMAIKNSAIRSSLYKINEQIVNMHSLLKVLAQKNYDECIKIDSAASLETIYAADGKISVVTAKVANQTVKFSAQVYVFTAGVNNLASQGSRQLASMQIRPLHMIWVKGPNLPEFYGHCIGLGTTPRLTITSHRAADGEIVWYLGGKIAESGVEQDEISLINQAKNELTDIFPNIDFSAIQIKTFRIDRAEANQADGSKPNDATIFSDQNKIIAWPTKMVLAPRLAALVLQYLYENKYTPSNNKEFLLPDLPKPQIKLPIWDEI